MNRYKFAGHIACIFAYAIFGLNIILCKDLTSGMIPPLTIFTLRALGAGSLFWFLSIFTPKEKVELKDLPKIFAASFLGFFLCQVTFLVALPEVTPMDCSLIASLSPIYTMFIAAYALKEPITAKKAAGVVISLIGVVILILNSISINAGGQNSSIRGLLIIASGGLSFSIYLGIFKPLISKYSVVTFMKWIFLFALILSLPFTAKDIVNLNWTAIPPAHLWDLAYLIIFATFISYFLIPFAQKRIRPTLVSIYGYIQPIVAIVISIAIGMDVLTWQKVLAVVMVFCGVILVSSSRSANSQSVK